VTGVVVGMKTDEITIQDPEEDLATDRKDPNGCFSRVRFISDRGSSAYL